MHLDIHLVPADIADDVIDVSEPDGLSNGVWRRRGGIARQEDSSVIFAFDERLNRVAVQCNVGDDNFAVGVSAAVDFSNCFCAALHRCGQSLASVVDAEGNCFYAIAVAAEFLGCAELRPKRGGENEADFALLEDITYEIARTGFWTLVGDKGKAKGGAIKMSGLLRVADIELKVVDALKRKEVGVHKAAMTCCKVSNRRAFSSPVPMEMRIALGMPKLAR